MVPTTQGATPVVPLSVQTHAIRLRAMAGHGTPTPTQPGKPTEPGKPTPPGTPSEPGKPSTPGTPSDPYRPEDPATPPVPRDPGDSHDVPGGPDQPPEGQPHIDDPRDPRSLAD